MNQGADRGGAESVGDSEHIVRSGIAEPLASAWVLTGGRGGGGWFYVALSVLTNSDNSCTRVCMAAISSILACMVAISSLSAWFSCSIKSIFFFIFARVPYMRVGFGWGRRATFETGVTFYGKEKLVRLGFETMRCKMMHDVMRKLTHFLFIEGIDYNRKLRNN